MDKHHILVVDDNHINRLFFQSSLKKLNTKVSLAESGFDAVEICRQQHFDLILMDIRMDGMDGIQTAAAIKALNTHRNTPILAVSAERFDFKNHPDFENSLLKPISQNDLKLVINAFIPHETVDDVVFDEKLALQISHEDHGIVKKLRDLLIEQLEDDWQQIDFLYSKKKWKELDNLLHKILGSARICAATLLIHRIKALKTNIKIQQQDDPGLHQLKLAIEKTTQINELNN